MQMRALWWWIDRWRKSTAYTDMTLEQQGAYRNLLDEACLRGGPLPNDDGILAKACGDPRRWNKVRAAVLKHFTLYPDGWRNTTLDAVLKRSEEIRHDRAESGRAGAKQRWQTHSKRDGKPDGKPIATAMANPMAPDPDPIVVSSQTPQKTRTVDVSPEALDLRAGNLVERYAELFYLHRRGARYHSRLHLDFMKAQELVRTWADDAHLEKLAVIILESDDDWIAKTDRGFGVFAARATWADDRLKAWELANGITA